jgi:hypothetical protein
MTADAKCEVNTGHAQDCFTNSDWHKDVSLCIYTQLQLSLFKLFGCVVDGIIILKWIFERLDGGAGGLDLV